MLQPWPLAKVGQPAPDFSVPSHSGKTIRLQDYRGRFLLIESGGPLQEMNYVHSVLPALKQVYQEKSGQGLEILSLSLCSMGILDLHPAFDYFVSYYEIPWKILYVEIIQLG